MGYYRSRGDSVQDAFSLSPLPYPVLLILILVLLLASISWSASYESIMEAVEEQFSWALIAAPILLIFAVRWLSSIENSHQLFQSSAYDYRKRSHHRPPEGPPPWGAALLIVLLLLMVSYQSTFHDQWFA